MIRRYISMIDPKNRAPAFGVALAISIALFCAICGTASQLAPVAAHSPADDRSLPSYIDRVQPSPIPADFELSQAITAACGLNPSSRTTPAPAPPSPQFPIFAFNVSFLQPDGVFGQRRPRTAPLEDSLESVESVSMPFCLRAPRAPSPPGRTPPPPA